MINLIYQPYTKEKYNVILTFTESARKFIAMAIAQRYPATITTNQGTGINPEKEIKFEMNLETDQVLELIKLIAQLNQATRQHEGPAVPKIAEQSDYSGLS